MAAESQTKGTIQLEGLGSGSRWALADGDLVTGRLERGFDFGGNVVWHSFLNLKGASQGEETLIEVVPKAGSAERPLPTRRQ